MEMDRVKKRDETGLDDSQIGGIGKVIRTEWNKMNKVDTLKEFFNV